MVFRIKYFRERRYYVDVTKLENGELRHVYSPALREDHSDAIRSFRTQIREIEGAFATELDNAQAGTTVRKRIKVTIH